MSISGFLIILGCLVAGYWIVSSIMAPGIDEGEEARKVEPPKAEPRKVGPRDVARRALPAPGRKPAAVTRVESAAPMSDWYIVLDVPPDASRNEIQAAMKRRLAMAEAAGDTIGAARIARAAETALNLRR